MNDPVVSSRSRTFVPAFLAVGLPLGALALGHTISNLIRTLPAISADLIAQDLGVTAGEVAAMTGLYHLAFAAGQLPVGVALDRYGVRRVSLVLLVVVVLGGLITALIESAVGFVLGQIVLGLGCCGMLLCPMTYAAKQTDDRSFPIWSAAILAIGNTGMVLSASPMAWLVAAFDWRAAYLVSALLAGLVAIGVVWGVRAAKETEHARSVVGEFKEVSKLAVSRRLRGVVMLAFVSFAVMIGLRGMWGGPWLMEIKGVDRVEAGNFLLLLTIALIASPMLIGLIDRKTGHRRTLLASGHILAGITLLLLPAGAAGGWLSSAFGQAALPSWYDLIVYMAFGVLISVQPLLFALGREAVPAHDAGKALAAVNFSFFVGAAAIQGLSAPINDLFGITYVLMFLGGLSIAGGVLFWSIRR